MSKEKAIEICNNLTLTISRLSDKLLVESKSSVYKNVTASKRDLVSKKNILMKKHSLTSKDLWVNKMKNY